MSPERVSKILKKARPKTDSEILKLLPITCIGGGCSRNVYRVKGTEVVIKVPYRTGRSHARREISRINQIMSCKKFRHLQRYIPKIYYSCYKTGIIAMERLAVMRISKLGEAKEEIIARMFEDSFERSFNSMDIHLLNMGKNKKGQIKCFDLGLA